MKKVLIVILAAAMIFGAAACQKSPDNPFIAGKNLDRMIEKANDRSDAAGALADRLKIPESLVLDIKKDNLAVTANAPIILPDAEVLPTVRITNADFSQELVDKLWNALVGDTQMYQVEDRLSKEQIKKEITGWQLVASGQAEGSKEQAEQKIDELKAAYASAPEQAQKVEAGSEISTVTERGRYSGEFLSEYPGVYAAEKSDLSVAGEYKVFHVKNNYEGDGSITVKPEDYGNGESGEQRIDTASRGAVFSYSSNNNALGSGTYITVNMGAVNEDTMPKNAKAAANGTLGDALSKANAFLADIGVDGYMSVEADKTMAGYVFEAKDFAEYPPLEDVTAGKYDDKIKNVVYTIPCARLVGGAVLFAMEGGSSIGDPDFGSGSWAYESLKILVMNGEICGVEWKSPYEVLDTVAESTSLMLFDEISDIAGRMLFVSNAYTDKDGKMEISAASLSMLRIMEQNNLKNGLLIPAWTFYGKQYYYEDYGLGGEWVEVHSEDGVLLTINAIDGSIIDPIKGY